MGMNVNKLWEFYWGVARAAPQSPEGETPPAG